MGNPAQAQTQATPPAVVDVAAMKARQRTGSNRVLPLHTANSPETYKLSLAVFSQAVPARPSPEQCTTEQLFDIVIDVARRFRTVKEVVEEHRDYILRLKVEVFKVRFGSYGVKVPVRCCFGNGRPRTRRMTWKEFCESQFGVTVVWINRLCSGKAGVAGNVATVERPTNGGSGNGWNTVLTNLVKALEPCGDSLPLSAKQALEAAQELLEDETYTESERGEPGSGGRYWLTPRDVYASLDDEFNFDFDSCPYPRPEGFDGLAVPWGRCSYVNPPFVTVAEGGRKVGMTAWVKKALQEQAKGNTSVLVYPQHGWVHLLVEAGAELRSLGKVNWIDIGNETSARAASSPIMAFILRGHRDKRRS
jgi:hypothetical protein